MDEQNQLAPPNPQPPQNVPVNQPVVPDAKVAPVDPKQTAEPRFMQYGRDSRPDGRNIHS